MRPRKEIEADGARKDILTLEVLLDIRDLLWRELLSKEPPEKKKPGRPKKNK